MSKKITKADIKKMTKTLKKVVKVANKKVTKTSTSKKPTAKKKISGSSTSGCNSSYSSTGSCFSTMGMKSCGDESRCSTKIKGFLERFFS